MVNFFRILLLVLVLSLAATVNADTPHQLDPILLVSISGVDADSPAISGNIVVFEDNRARPETTMTDVYGTYWGSVNQFVIAATGSYEAKPNIDGNVVVWQSNPNGVGCIFGKNLVTGEQYDIASPTSSVPLDNNTYEAYISGDLVVWERGTLTARDIWGKYLSGGDAFPIVEDFLDNNSVRVSGDIVVWNDIFFNEGLGTSVGIRAKDLSDGTIYQVSSTGANPDVSGHVVVWHEYIDDTQESDIFGMNLLTGERFEIASGVGRQKYPQISGDNVIWMDYELGCIAGKNISTGYEFTASGTHVQMDIDGNRLVWAMPVDGDWCIYGAAIPEPSTITLLSIGAILTLILCMCKKKC